MAVDDWPTVSEFSEFWKPSDKPKPQPPGVTPWPKGYGAAISEEDADELHALGIRWPEPEPPY